MPHRSVSSPSSPPSSPNGDLGTANDAAARREPERVEHPDPFLRDGHPDDALADLEEPAAPRNTVETRGLTLRFGAAEIIRDIDMIFTSGTITALIGPTGSGKSTFLRTINRMNDRVRGFSHRGDVLLDGESIWSGRRDLLELRRTVGMVFQRPNPFPMSIRDNVVVGAKAHRIARGRQLDALAEHRLREVGLWDAVKDRLSDSPFRLSGGQQQLLCLARALATGPEVLLLDEPTSALDPISTEYVEDLVRRLAPALTIVLVTHNLQQARRVAHHTMFLYDGVLVEHGPTAELFESPSQVQTAHYVGGLFG